MRILSHITLLLLLCNTTLYAQNTKAYVSPIEAPISLAGNFGEVRSTHFHSGVDIKTDGVIGKRILSVADGYISRISVSPTGYGNAIYITHPALNTMSVYAHLDRFNDKVKKYVEEHQYKNKKFKSEIYPNKELFRVKAGEFIAYSGNSGSSLSPHLHFEMRSTQTMHTLDPIKECGYNVTDTTPPKLFSITVVNYDSTYGVPIFEVGKTYKLQQNSKGNYSVVGDTITLNRDSYLVFEVIETKDNTINIYGTQHMELYRKDDLFWGYDIPSISFSTSRSVNSFTHFPKIVNNRNDFIRTYISDANRLTYYKGSSKDGVLRKHNHIVDVDYRLIATDEAGNSSSVEFVVTSSKQPIKPLGKPIGSMIMAKERYTYHNPLSKIEFDKYSLQQSAFLNIITESDTTQRFTTVVNIPYGEPPFNHGVDIYIKPTTSQKFNSSKLLIGSIKKGSSKIYPVGGEYRDGYVKAAIYGGGKYVVTEDTTPPTIRSLTPSADPTKVLKFTITDDLSGVGSYIGWINDKWALFEYDSKNNLITCHLNDSIAMKGLDNSCVISVTDKKGNKSTYKTTFIW